MSKQRNICLSGNNSTQQPTARPSEMGIFSWSFLLAIVLTVKNRLPEPWRDVIPVENVRDLKHVILLLFVLFSAFALAGMYDRALLMEGGSL